ncbi:MAG TPA: aspartate--ammonia ligase [Bacteroidetes bacterium]|nr:aspartate--ammonia ligase [Bacteroidota bacterium]
MKANEIIRTEAGIRLVKETFSRELARELDLIPISSPLIVSHDSGLNDNLNGVERPVRFPLRMFNGQQAEVVQSLAKWKRLRLKELEIEAGRGILTDMRALRPDEETGPLHSVYVDQWDWEKHITPEERSLKTLRAAVEKIYRVIRHTEKTVAGRFPETEPILPEDITFLHAEELRRRYPGLSPGMRETEAARQYGALFIIGIGTELSDGTLHDGRAPDYDDWITENEEGTTGLNGDIILWNPVLERAFEISSMGIRVDPASLLRQLAVRGCMERKNLPFHRMLLEGQLPQSMGGGIGQSRLCMFMLRKRHIGEVQVGFWTPETISDARSRGIMMM